MAELGENEIKAQVIYGCKDPRVRRWTMEKPRELKELIEKARANEFSEEQERGMEVNYVNNNRFNRESSRRNNQTSPKEALFNCKWCGREHVSLIELN